MTSFAVAARTFNLLLYGILALIAIITTLSVTLLHGLASSQREEIPRRVCLEKMTVAERSILEAVGWVEAAGADVRLTDAVILLQAARDSVADFVDGVDTRRYVQTAPTRASLDQELGSGGLSYRQAAESYVANDGWGEHRGPVVVRDLLLEVHRMRLIERERASQLEAFKAAARKFLTKVETGHARSVETYAEMKTALEMLP